MRNILTALCCVAGMGVALAFGIGVVLIGFPSPTPEWEYKWCDTFDNFALKAEQTGGVYVVGDESPIGHISVVGWADGSFGVFVYLEETDTVCVITTGTFASITLSIPGVDEAPPAVIPKVLGKPV